MKLSRCLLSIALFLFVISPVFGQQTPDDVILPYRSYLRTSGMDANIILTTGFAQETGDFLRFYVPGADPNNQIRQADVPRLIITENGDLMVRYQSALRLMGPLQHNKIFDTGFADDIGHFLKFYVPGNNIEGTSKLVLSGNGNVGVGIHPLSKLHVNGTTTTNVLTITGGSDLSEYFVVNLPEQEFVLTPGMLVCIDQNNPGELIICTQEYDSTVAGIVSGAGEIDSGIILSQQNTIANGEVAVSLVGRVYCLVDASESPVFAGDLLTSSFRPGFAKKAADHSKAQGAIIGKAMTSLNSGTGLVLTLVTLQ